MAKRPFLEDGSQFGVSRTAFRKMRKADKREAMIEWFHQNYEDPAQRTMYISAEGGYMWNHGGPYDAKEQLDDMFGDLVSENLIDEVTEAVEADGIAEWAPVHDEYQDDEERPDFGRAPATLDDFSDETSPTYGSPADLSARERVNKALDELQKVLDNHVHVGIGHNQPPESIEAHQLTEVRLATIELKTEFAKPEPKIPVVKTWGKRIFGVLAACGAAVGLGMFSGIGNKIGQDYLANPVIRLLQTTYNEIFHWLQIAAQYLT